MTWDPGGTAQVREIALVMVEQGPNVGLGWAKSHGSSGVLCGDVLWYPMCERGAQQQLGPLRAGLTSATSPASGSRSRRGGYYRLLHQVGSASLKTERLLYQKLQTSTMARLAVVLLLSFSPCGDLPERIPPGAQQLPTGGWGDGDKTPPLLLSVAILDF